MTYTARWLVWRALLGYPVFLIQNLLLPFPSPQYLGKEASPAAGRNNVTGLGAKKQEPYSRASNIL